MIHFRKFNTLEQTFSVLLCLLAVVTLTGMRHFSTALLWISAAALWITAAHRKNLVHQGLSFLNPRPVQLILGLLGLSLLSVFWSINPKESLISSLSNLATFGLLVFFFVSLKAWKEGGLETLLDTLFLICALSLILLLSQTSFHFSFKSFLGLGDALLKPNVALLLSLALVLSTYLLLKERAGGSLKVILLLGGVLIGCYQTSYQAGLFGVLIGALAALLTYYGPRFIPWACAYLTALYTLALPFIVLSLTKIVDLKQVWDSYPHHSSLVHRFYIWEFVSQKILERPFLGWGLAVDPSIPGSKICFAPGCELLPSHPHNHILQIWLELGLVGAVGLAFVHFFIFRALARLNNRVATSFGMFFVTSTFVILNLSHSLWHKWWITWLGATSILLWIVIKRFSEPNHTR
jgi:O-antigen ligase